MDSLLMPVGRPVSAIAAGYLGLVSFFPIIGVFTGIAGVTCGFVALKQINNDASLIGRGRAWFGIVAGSAMALLQVVLIVLIAANKGRSCVGGAWRG